MDQKFKTVLIILALVVLVYVIITPNWYDCNGNNCNKEKYEQIFAEQNKHRQYSYNQTYVDPRVDPYSRAVSYRPYAQLPQIRAPPKPDLLDSSSDTASSTVMSDENSCKKVGTCSSDLDTTPEHVKVKISSQLGQNSFYSDIDDTDASMNPDRNQNVLFDHVADQQLGLNVDPNTHDTEPQINKYNIHHRVTLSNPKKNIFDQQVKNRRTSYTDTQIDGDLVYDTNNIVGYCTAPNEHFSIYSSSGEDTRIIPMNDTRFGPSLDQVAMGIVVQDNFPDRNLDTVDGMTEEEMTMTDCEYIKLLKGRSKTKILMDTDCTYDKKQKKNTCVVSDMNDVADRYRLNTVNTYRGLYKNSSTLFANRSGGKMYDTVD
jgi:hypothetical protein